MSDRAGGRERERGRRGGLVGGWVDSLGRGMLNRQGVSVATHIYKQRRSAAELQRERIAKAERDSVN